MLGGSQAPPSPSYPFVLILKVVMVLTSVPWNSVVLSPAQLSWFVADL